jgi:signal transduction histidine kinase/PAS domain-containing protein/ActR/RegA family two-component response regulator
MNVDLHYPKQRLVRYRAISIGLAVFAFCIGGVALLGWILDNPYLKRIHPSLVTMKANTAVCLMLVAVPCFLINDRSPSQFNTVIRRLFAAIVALIGLVTLSEHLFGWNTGLDQLLFHESVQEAGLSFPGRMGVAASLNFFFLGIALLFQDARTRRAFRVSNLAVILVVTVTLLVFLYYFYGIERVERIAQYFTIALHTVVAFVSLCVSILLARPERGMIATLLGKSPGAIVARRMLPAFLVVIILGWIRTITRNSEWFSANFSTAAFVVAVLLLLAVLIWLTALSLNRTDRERRVAELALGDSEARLAALLEQLPVGIGLTDREGRFLIRNSVLNNFVGDRLSSFDPVFAARWRAWDEDGRLLDPSEWPSARALRGESVSPGCEMLYTAADGKQIWTRVLSVPFRDETDELSGVIVVVQDIDEQRLAENRLDVLVRVSELIRTIQDPYELSYAVAETLGRHLQVRRCLFNETDVERDLEIVHRDYTDGARSVAGEHRISEYSTITTREMQLGNTVVNNDSKTDPRTAADFDRIYGPNGERAYVAVPLMREGRWVASLWASDDRPRQWTKEELSLLQTVAERTWTAVEKLRAEAERERLLTSVQEARDAAEKANQLKDEFLATLSHELRNPLNVILGYSELLLRMPEIEQSPRLVQMGEALRRNAQSQSQLINDLLDLSRLQRGKISLNQETVSMPAIIDNAVETVRADAVTKGIDIRVNVGDQLLLVEGDRLRLQQIAWNLLNNAVKFTPAGGSIEIALRSENESAVFVVTDTGQGIDASFLPHVFEMFRQADGSNRRRHGGLGIGLALVHQLVQLHGGKISAESDGPNKGARFTVRLPLLREPERLGSPVATQAGTVELNVFAQTSFLIVDDSEDTITILEELLKVAGANVMTATNGADALRLAAENEFDVILSDISMPEMDGYEFLQRLRKIDGRQNVPVIAITGFGRNADIARARAAGFYSHLTKPLNLQVLTDVLQQLANERDGLSDTSPDVDYDISAGPVF